MDKFIIQSYEEVSSGLGYEEVWTDFKTVSGYIDLLSGKDFKDVQNAFTEDSTHILIIPGYQPGITDKMRIVDKDNRFYFITYSDNPVGLNHHNEIYLKFGGDIG